MMGIRPETDIRPDEDANIRSHREIAEGENTRIRSDIADSPTSASRAETDTHAEADAHRGIDDDQRVPSSSWREQLELQTMRQAPREKQWLIPAQADKGPVQITVRMPEVRVGDSAGRHILIGPEQAEVLGSRLIGIRDWLQNGHEDWVGDDDRDEDDM